MWQPPYSLKAKLPIFHFGFPMFCPGYQNNGITISSGHISRGFVTDYFLLLLKDLPDYYFSKLNKNANVMRSFTKIFLKMF